MPSSGDRWPRATDGSPATAGGLSGVAAPGVDWRPSLSPREGRAMPWLFLLIAAALLAVALTTPSMLMLVVCGLASLGLTVFAVMSLLAQRVDSSARSDAMLIDPQELRRLREQAEARRAQSVGDADSSRDGA
jgi:hypothetical protein